MRTVVAIIQMGMGLAMAHSLFYAFQLIAARSLGPTDFGLIAPFLAIIYLGASIGNAIQLWVANSVVTGRYVFVIKLLSARYVYTSIACSSLVGLLAALVFSFIGVPAVIATLVFALLVVGIAIWFMWILSACQGVLHGAQNFRSLSTSFTISGAARFGFGATAMVLGANYFGFLLAIATAAFVSATAVWWKIHNTPIVSFSISSLLLPSAAQSWRVPLIGSVLLAIPGSLDVIFARMYWSPEVAGFYSGGTVIGKIVLFFGIAIATVLYPRFARISIMQNVKMLVEIFMLVALAIIGLASFALLMAESAVVLLLGDLFAPSVDLASVHIVGMALFSLSSFFIYWHMAINGAAPLLIMLIAIGLGMVLSFSIFYSDPYQVAKSLAWTYAGVLAIGAVGWALQIKLGNSWLRKMRGKTARQL